MRTAVVATLLAGGICLVACDRTPYDPRLVQRVADLEDSLRSYRDSLRAVQLAWSFNYVTPIVKLQDDEIKLGDSCRFQVFVGAANSPDASSLGYRYYPARLELNDLPGARVEQQAMSWIVAFKPNRLGADSISGKLWVDNVRSGPTDLMFSSYFNVVRDAENR